jgi:ribonuclease HI
MDPALDEVMAKELSLHGPAVRASPDAVRALLHDEFREFGASGTVWDRVSIVAALSGEPDEPIAAREMAARRLADDVVLLTYTAQRLERTTLRSSVWVHDGG